MARLLVLSLLVISNYNVDCHNVTIDVKTTSGLVRGQTITSWLNTPLNATIRQFLGIPYAKPPIGELRFAKPQAISSPLPGVIDATNSKNSCMQVGMLTNIIANDTSEDCLVLNIWTKTSPVTSIDLKPVMFWIYGGALSVGSINEPQYFGGLLAAHDVILVAVNYRVGTFGFLYTNDSTTPGNVGFYDQNLALEWVRDNIHLFGGDKSQITIFGESAGSWSVGAHIISPESNGMFSRAIMQSAALLFDKNHPKITKEVAIQSAHELGAHVNCTGTDKELVKCLRSVSAVDLLAANLLTYDTNIKITWPVVGTEFLPISPQDAFKEKRFNNKIDLMSGVVKTEGSVFVSLLNSSVIHDHMTKEDLVLFYKIVEKTFPGVAKMDVAGQYLKNLNQSDPDAIKFALYNSFGDISITCPTYFFAKLFAQMSETKSRTFLYQLTHSHLGEAVEKAMGIIHSADIAFVFGTPLFDPKSSEEDIQFSRLVMKYWTDFAKYGKPSNDWPEMIIKSEIFARNLNIDTSNKESKFYEVCESFWKNYFLG